MKTLIATVLCVAMAATASSEAPPADCNGNCPMVAPPQLQSLAGPVKIAQGVAKAPVRVMQRVRSNKPVRGFLRRLFSR